MKIKTVEIDGKTYAEVQDGKPVYIGDDGKEIAFDAPGTAATISRLNGEAKGHREAKEAAEAALKSFEGLDAKSAREALDKLSKIDAKKLVEAGDMDAAIQTALKPVQDQLAAAMKDKDTLTGQLNKAVIGSAFGQSKFAAEKLTRPAWISSARYTQTASRSKKAGPSATTRTGRNSIPRRAPENSPTSTRSSRAWSRTTRSRITS